jgi:hypothetical protein
MPILFALFLSLLAPQEVINSFPASEKIVIKDYCKIYGSVYLERDPRYKNTASHTVFLDEEEVYANMIVYRENNKLFADGTAIWYITPTKAFADHILFVTDNRNFADFSVHYTTVRSYATCSE